jgi:hypothetical protein
MDNMRSLLTVVGLLPKFLEPTEKLKTMVAALESDPSQQLDGPAGWPCLINWLSLPFPYSPASRLRLLAQLEDIDNTGSIQAIRHEFRKPENKDYWAYSSEARYIVSKMALLSLSHIGLGIHGGLERLDIMIVACCSKECRLPTTMIIINDPEKAQQYVDIGVNLKENSPQHAEPATFEQAVDNYTKILEVVGKDEIAGMTEEEIDRKIENDQVGLGKLSDLKWEFEREKFRLGTRRRLRDAMIDKGIEERVNTSHFCITGHNLTDVCRSQR